jgi:hypothetical protein
MGFLTTGITDYEGSCTEIPEFAALTPANSQQTRSRGRALATNPRRTTPRQGSEGLNVPFHPFINPIVGIHEQRHIIARIECKSSQMPDASTTS